MLFDEKEILAITRWAKLYANQSPDRILLGSNDIPSEYRAAVATQIELWPRLRNKLPQWPGISSLYIPSRLSLEQSSGAVTSSYKSRFIREGTKVVDLTGGLGIDFIALMSKASQGMYIERNDETAVAARHNIPLLLNEGKDVNILTGDFKEYLPLIKTFHPDYIYVDPARRSGADKRVYAIADCEPDLIPLAAELLPFCSSILAKLSPMIDLWDTLQSLPHVQELHVVAAHGEVKELLVRMSLNEATIPPEKVPIHAINLLSEDTVIPFIFTMEEERSISIPYTDSIDKYVYEPHTALLKAGAFKTVAYRLGLRKLHPNSHLYTSEAYESAFPGRTFVLEEIIPFSTSVLKQLGKVVPQASISCRNFPLSPIELRQRSKMADGGEKTLMGTTMADGKKVLLLLRKAE